MSSLQLTPGSMEDLLVGIRSDGKPYTVRKHRKEFLTPEDWVKMMKQLKTEKSMITAETLIQTGARINEARHIEERDLDYDRNTLRLRVVKTKARKKGEERGVPRTIPINSAFIKMLKRHFKNLEEGSKIGLLSTSAFNRTFKRALKEAYVKNWHLLSVHNIRKTHGNWLKIMGNLRLMNIDASEICLRLGHDYNTFLKDYGSSGVLNNQDIMILKKILGDLYQ